MKPDERRRRIADLVKEASRASVEELAGLLDTSRETVRRDLALLSEQGVLRKVHGGAVYTQTALESPLKERYAAARQEKLALARGRSAAVPARAIHFLSTRGTTTALFAAALGRAGSFTVITNSLLVARELRECAEKERGLSAWRTPLRRGRRGARFAGRRADPAAAGGPCGADGRRHRSAVAAASISTPRRLSSRGR